MTTQPKAQKIAQALTDDQRELMRKNIEVYLCISEDVSRNIIQRKTDDKQRAINAEAEMTRAGLGTKMNVWMKGLLSTKGGANAYVNVKMEALRSAIQAAKTDLVDMTAFTLRPGFADAAYELYEAVQALFSAFLPVFRDRSRLEGMLMALLLSRMPNLKTKLTDFANLDEMKEIFIKSENKGELVNHVIARLDAYMGGLNDGLFSQLAEGVSAAYYFRNLADFAWADLFRTFGHLPGDGQDGQAPAFRPAAGSECLEFIERLFYCVYPFMKARESGLTNFALFPEMLECLAAEQDTAGLQQRLIGIFAAAEEFSRNAPLAAIIRFLRNDPYYKMLVYFPKVKLRQFYETAVRLQVLGEVDKSFQGIRLGIIETLTKNLFKDRRVRDFEFYRGSAPAMVTKLGLPTFTYVRSLSLMQNFIVQHYYGYMQDLIHNLNRIVAVRNRDDLTRMLLHAAGLEDLADVIRKFDQSFSPESAEGKSFYRMRYALEKEMSQQKNYRSFIIEKDIECRTMIARGMEHGTGLASVFRAILADTNTVLRERLLNMKSAQVVSRRYDDVLKQSIEAIDLAFKIIRQLMRIEEGA